MYRYAIPSYTEPAHTHTHVHRFCALPFIFLLHFGFWYWALATLHNEPPPGACPLYALQQGNVSVPGTCVCVSVCVLSSAVTSYWFKLLLNWVHSAHTHKHMKMGLNSPLTQVCNCLLHIRIALFLSLSPSLCEVVYVVIPHSPLYQSTLVDKPLTEVSFKSF